MSFPTFGGRFYRILKIIYTKRQPISGINNFLFHSIFYGTATDPQYLIYPMAVQGKTAD